MREKLGIGDTPPPGGVFHAAAIGEDGKIRIFEVWNFRAEAEGWGQKVMVARTKAGFWRRPAADRIPRGSANTTSGAACLRCWRSGAPL